MQVLNKPYPLLSPPERKINKQNKKICRKEKNETMRDKLIKLLDGAVLEMEFCTNKGKPVARFPTKVVKEDCAEALADYLVANGVTVQTEPISYERLLKLAKKMHTWIFLNTGDEQEVYDKLGITEEENYVFGYGGKIEMPLPKAPKENDYENKRV